MIYKSLLVTSLIVSSSFSLEFDKLDITNQNKLTLEQVVNLSLINDSWIRGNKYAQEAIESKSTSVASYADPKITIGALNLPTDGFDFNQEGMTQLKIGISQIFPRGDSLEIKQEQLKLKASQFSYQREDRKSKLTAKISHLWLNAYKAQESISLIKNNLFLFERLINVVESSYSATIGRSKQQDIIRAQLELTKLDDKITMLEQNKDAFLSKISEWLYTFSDGENILKYSTLTLPKELPNIKMINSTTLNSNINSQTLLNIFSEHPSIRNIDQKIKSVSKGVLLSKEKYKPQFGINTSYGYRGDDLMGKSRSDLLSVGVSFDIPIFTKNKQDKEVQTAILNLKSVKTEKFVQLRKHMASFENAKVNLLRLKDRYSIYKNKLIPQINEEVEATLTAYTNDEGDFADVVRSRITQLNTKIDMLNINVEIQKYIINYNYLFATNAKDIINTVSKEGKKL